MYKKILALDLTSGIINRVKHTEIEDKIARNIFFIKSIPFLSFSVSMKSEEVPWGEKKKKENRRKKRDKLRPDFEGGGAK